MQKQEKIGVSLHWLFFFNKALTMLNGVCGEEFYQRSVLKDSKHLVQESYGPADNLCYWKPQARGQISQLQKTAETHHKGCRRI